MKLRLTSWFILGILVLSAVGVGVTYVVLENRSTRQIDAELTRQLATYADYVSSADTVADLERLTQEYLSGPSVDSLLSTGSMLALVTNDGQVIASPGEARLEEALPDLGVGDSEPRPPTDVEIGGAAYRVAASPVMSGGVPAGVVAVAAPVGPTRDMLSRVLTVLIVAAVAGTVAIGLGAWLLIDRALEPVRRIATTAEAITQRDLSGRIAYSGPKDEIGGLTDTMNAMLERLQSAFEAQERFILDVSHELRTPLTIAKGHLQVLDRQDAPDPDFVRSEHRLVLDELDRMNRLVADLLLIARSVRTDFLRPESVDLDRLLSALVGQGSALAERVWSVEASPRGTIQADHDRLIQAFLNLMRNAVEHTRTGDVIALGGRRVSDGVLLWVRDEGEGMTPEVQAHVFDRFYSAGGSEGTGTEPASEGGGLGLGLAIVRAIVLAHGGTLAVQSEPGRGSTFTMTLPADTSPGG